MVGIKNLSNSMKCPRNFRDFLKSTFENDNINKSSQLVSSNNSNEKTNTDIQRGDFFEAMVQKSIVNDARNNEYVICELTNWESRCQEIYENIIVCKEDKSFRPLIEYLAFEELGVYWDVSAHPGVTGKLKSMWKKYQASFTNTFNVEEGVWAKEGYLENDWSIFFEEDQNTEYKIKLRGRCDLIQITDEQCNVIEIKATKKLEPLHKYQLNFYGLFTQDLASNQQMYFCHNGKFKHQYELLEERKNTLTKDIRNAEYCPGCLDNSCSYRY